MSDIKEIVDEIRCIEEDKQPMDSAVMLVRHLSALADEVERLTKCLHTANASTEEFERRWNLALGEIEDMKEQNSEPAHKQYLTRLRDEFAAKAMQALITHYGNEIPNGDGYIECARESYKFADAMMKARNK